MNHEDVQKVSNAANAKITLLQNNFLKYFMRAVMAGFFIVVAKIFSNVVGNVFAGAEEPAWGKFLKILCTNPYSHMVILTILLRMRSLISFVKPESLVWAVQVSRPVSNLNLPNR